jgi:hypothetical protein
LFFCERALGHCLAPSLFFAKTSRINELRSSPAKSVYLKIFTLWALASLSSRCGRFSTQRDFLDYTRPPTSCLQRLDPSPESGMPGARKVFHRK